MKTDSFDHIIWLGIVWELMCGDVFLYFLKSSFLFIVDLVLPQRTQPSGNQQPLFSYTDWDIVVWRNSLPKNENSVNIDLLQNISRAS